MIKLLIKYALPAVFFLVVGIVTYNYFFGTDEEKRQAQELVTKVSGLGSDVVELISSEKEKFDAGKYDSAMTKMDSAFQDIKKHATAMADGGKQYLDKLDELEQQKAEVQQKIDAVKSVAQSPSGQPASPPDTAELNQLNEQFGQLVEQTDRLAQDMGNRRRR